MERSSRRSSNPVANRGFIKVRDGAPQIPVGTEVAIVQLPITLDDQLRPTPTSIVESVRLRVFRNVDGGAEPPTNTGIGMNVSELTLKRRLLFDGLKQGGTGARTGRSADLPSDLSAGKSPRLGRHRQIVDPRSGRPPLPHVGRTNRRSDDLLACASRGGRRRRTARSRPSTCLRRTKPARCARCNLENSPRNLPSFAGLPG